MVPHILSEAQNAIWVQCSQSLLTILREKQARAWHDIVTLDESWFYYITDHEPIWLPPDGKVPDRERITMESKKAMLTIVCGPTGFAVVTALESAYKSNAG
jgi:predicted cupin superfamily sugar epimerase